MHAASAACFHRRQSIAVSPSSRRNRSRRPAESISVSGTDVRYAIFLPVQAQMARGNTNRPARRSTPPAGSGWTAGGGSLKARRHDTTFGHGFPESGKGYRQIWLSNSLPMDAPIPAQRAPRTRLRSELLPNHTIRNPLMVDWSVIRAERIIAPHPVVPRGRAIIISESRAAASALCLPGVSPPAAEATPGGRRRTCRRRSPRRRPHRAAC